MPIQLQHIEGYTYPNHNTRHAARAKRILARIGNAIGHQITLMTLSVVGWLCGILRLPMVALVAGTGLMSIFFWTQGSIFDALFCTVGAVVFVAIMAGMHWTQKACIRYRDGDVYRTVNS